MFLQKYSTGNVEKSSVDPVKKCRSISENDKQSHCSEKKIHQNVPLDRWE